MKQLLTDSLYFCDENEMLFLLKSCVILTRNLRLHPQLSLSNIGILYLLQVTIKMIPRIDYNQMRGAMKSVAVSI